MKLFTVRSAAVFWRKYAIIFLSFSWLLGLLCGLFYWFHSFQVQKHLFLSAYYADASILDIFLISILPVLVSVLFVYVNAPVLLIPLAFIKAFSFSACSIGFLWAFGTAGWLLRLLFMFSDCILVLVLLWFWIRHISGDRMLLRKDTFTCVKIMLMVGIFDFLFIVPIIQTVFNS